MPRQATMTPDEMRALFLRCAEEIVTRDGVKNATARNIATRAGYTAGTLYTCFRNLDDLLTQLQIIVLERLHDRLALATLHLAGDCPLEAVTRAYLEFAYENPALWCLVQQDTAIDHKDLSEQFNAILASVRQVFQGATHGPPGQIVRSDETSHMIWAATHGLTGIAVSRKLGYLSQDAATRMATSLAACLRT